MPFKQGSCGYGELDKSKYPYWSVGALSTSNIYYGAGPVKGCGECFEVQCLQNNGQFAGRCNQDPNARSVTIMITDSCPECEGDHLDIQALTFNKMAPMALGRIDIQYRRVECTVPQDLNVIIDENRGAGGWIRLQVKDAAGRGSVKLVQVKGSNSDWESMNNVWGASWESTSVPAPPLDFRIQDDAGTEVTAFSVVTANGETGTLPTGINFQFSGGSFSSGPSSSPGTPNNGSNPIPQPKVTTAILDDTTITTSIIGESFAILRVPPIRKGGPTSPATAAPTATTEAVFRMNLHESPKTPPGSVWLVNLRPA
ncbi:g2150 [Coccomyxa elongata]